MSDIDPFTGRRRSSVLKSRVLNQKNDGSVFDKFQKTFEERLAEAEKKRKEDDLKGRQLGSDCKFIPFRF